MGTSGASGNPTVLEAAVCRLPTGGSGDGGDQTEPCFVAVPVYCEA